MTISIKEDTLTLIKEYIGDNHCMELLQFFAKYPYARFNKLAIVHALNNGGLQTIDKALKRLVANKLLCLCSQNNLVIYSLTEDITRRNAVSGLAALDLPQWQSLLTEKGDSIEGQKHIGIKATKAPDFLTGSIAYQPVPLISLAAK